MQVVSVLRPALDQYFPEQMGVRIIAEPGRYFAASAFTLAVNIIAKRTISSSDSTSCDPGNVSELLRGCEYWAIISRGVLLYSLAFPGTHCIYPRRDGQAELTWVAGQIARWYGHKSNP